MAKRSVYASLLYSSKSCVVLKPFYDLPHTHTHTSAIRAALYAPVEILDAEFTAVSMEHFHSQQTLGMLKWKECGDF